MGYLFESANFSCTSRSSVTVSHMLITDVRKLSPSTMYVLSGGGPFDQGQ